MSEVEVIQDGKEIAAYSPIIGQLAEIKKNNASIVFDYEDAADNKKARSYVHQLRKLKALTDKERKAAKAESLAYGRRVDAEAKTITVEIEEMIAVHAEPLAEIEQRETDRIAGIQLRIENIRNWQNAPDGTSAAALRHCLSDLDSTKIDDGFQEFTVEAFTVKERTVEVLNHKIKMADRREADELELERLRKAAEDRAQKDREDQIRKVAADKAKADAEEARLKLEAEAEQKHRREIEASERREVELRLERETAKREKAEAEARTERIAKETEDRMNREAAEKDIAEKADAEKRRKNVERREVVNSEITEALKLNGLHEAGITLLIQLVSDGKVPHMEINY